MLKTISLPRSIKFQRCTCKVIDMKVLAWIGCSILHITNHLVQQVNIRSLKFLHIMWCHNKSYTICNFKQASDVTWRGTHNESIKLITRANVSCLDLDIYKFKKTIFTTQNLKLYVQYWTNILSFITQLKKLNVELFYDMFWCYLLLVWQVDYQGNILVYFILLMP
jgi:hypothetical protein